MTQPKEIATLPPLEELHDQVPLSERTGQPRRPIIAGVGAIASYFAALALTISYGIHWWDAAHPRTYPSSSRLVTWLDPEPGKWLSLTLEGVLALALVIAAGSVAVAGFQAWNGWRWSRWAGLVAVGFTAGFAAVVNDWAYIGIGLAVVSAVLIFLPPMTKYFSQWDRVRNETIAPYRRPERIYYGRLPRFR